MSDQFLSMVASISRVRVRSFRSTSPAGAAALARALRTPSGRLRDLLHLHAQGLGVEGLDGGIGLLLGHQELVLHDGAGLLQGVENGFKVARVLPGCLGHAQGAAGGFEGSARATRCLRMSATGPGAGLGPGLQGAALGGLNLGLESFRGPVRRGGPARPR